MSDSSGNAAPIIIKRIKKVEGGHHGGAWKVAYADFVTAMMAFFLLLWLLSSTSEEQRNGISQYFTPTTGIEGALGIGFEGGTVSGEVGTLKQNLSEAGLVSGQVKQGPQSGPPAPEKELKVEQEDTGAANDVPDLEQDTIYTGQQQFEEMSKEEEEEDHSLKAVEQTIQTMMEETPELKQLQKNILVTNTPEGLRIDVTDDPENAMFLESTAKMTENGRMLFKAVSNVILKTPNRLAIGGHVEARVLAVGETYTNWELTADRANAVRRFLSSDAMEDDRIGRVEGHADQRLLEPGEPKSIRNRRVSLLLMRNEHVSQGGGSPASRGLLSNPTLDATKINQPKKSVVEPKPEPKPEPEETGPTLFDEDSEKSTNKGFSMPDKQAPTNAAVLSSPSVNTDKLKEVAKKKKATEVVEAENKPAVAPSGPTMFDSDSGESQGFAVPDKSVSANAPLLSTPSVDRNKLKEAAKKKAQEPVSAGKLEQEEEAPQPGSSLFDPTAESGEDRLFIP